MAREPEARILARTSMCRRSFSQRTFSPPCVLLCPPCHSVDRASSPAHPPSAGVQESYEANTVRGACTGRLDVWARQSYVKFPLGKLDVRCDWAGAEPR